MSFITRRGLFAAASALTVSACATPPRPEPLAEGWTPDATEIALRIRRGELTAREAVAEAIARAEALQPKLNFIVAPDFERALQKATAGAPAGPFGGVPTLMKDLVDVPGLPTRKGAAYTAGLPLPTEIDAHAAAWERAGFVSIGKSATPEHGFLPTTEPLAFGPTRNPWDPSRSSGGSSGGAAAAVAAGVVPMAHASDGGGSIRIPASCCGLFGLKPSRGRTWQKDPDIAVSDIGVELAVSRSVRDSAMLLSLVEKTGAAGLLPPVGLVSGPATRRLRVGLVLDTAVGRQPDAEVRAAIESTATLLTDLGHSVRPATWPMQGERFAQDFLTLWALGAADLVKSVPNPAQLEPFTLDLARTVTTMKAEDVGGLMGRLTGVAQQYDGWFADYDVVLSPVLAHPAVPLGFVRGDVPFEELRERLTDYVGYTPLANVAGAPAMSVPLAWTPTGLPVGSHVMARRGDERTLLELAYELEAARPWAMRRPPVSA